MDKGTGHSPKFEVNLLQLAFHPGKDEDFLVFSANLFLQSAIIFIFHFPFFWALAIVCYWQEMPVGPELTQNRFHRPCLVGGLERGQQSAVDGVALHLCLNDVHLSIDEFVVFVKVECPRCLWNRIKVIREKIVGKKLILRVVCLKQINNVFLVVYYTYCFVAIRVKEGGGEYHMCRTFVDSHFSAFLHKFHI